MKEIDVREDLLAENDQLAAGNRQLFKEENVFTVNLVGSPGCGKTSLLEKLLGELNQKLELGVIEGDLYTDKDAARLEKIGPKIVQINTGGGCHLEAEQIKEAVDEFPLAELDLLIIENVGNLVCPASFDLGEEMKITVLSVPEGNDKPVKYPAMFAKSEAVILNKIDLLSKTNFSRNQFYQDLKTMNEEIKIFEASCTTGQGIARVCEYLRGKAVSR